MGTLNPETGLPLVDRHQQLKKIGGELATLIWASIRIRRLGEIFCGFYPPKITGFTPPWAMKDIDDRLPNN
jgi:hypothetical protein